MSRCFPYQPPRLLKQGSVESFKLGRERVLPKTEQKLHEREKVKRKAKKDNYKSLPPAKKFKKLDDVLNGYKVEEHLEKSDLTEEHEQPVCYISDGSQNSQKRKRETVSYTECMVDGNKIKIKFSLKKPFQSDKYIVEDPSSSSNRREYSNQKSSSSVPPLTERKLSQDVGRKGKGSLVPSLSVPSVPEQKVFHDDCRNGQGPPSVPSCSVAPSHSQNPSYNDVRKEQVSPFRTSTKDKKILKSALEYKTLIEGWLPPVLQEELNDNDSGDDWLLPKSRLVKPAAKSSNSNNVPCVASTSWPRAQYLPGAEIYALPYTVPF